MSDGVTDVLKMAGVRQRTAADEHQVVARGGSERRRIPRQPVRATAKTAFPRLCDDLLERWVRDERVRQPARVFGIGATQLRRRRHAR